MKRAMKAAAMSFALVLGGAIALPGSASAHYSGNGQPVANIPVNPYSYNSTWQVPMDRALSNWNNSASPAYIRKESSRNTITVASYPDLFHGEYTNCSAANVCYVIKMNSTRIANYSSSAGIAFASYVTDVLVHEYGHAFNLGHNSVYSIMNENRNRSMTYPTDHDIADVNDYY